MPGTLEVPRLRQSVDRIVDVDRGFNLEQLKEQVTLLVAVDALVELVVPLLFRQLEAFVGHDPGKAACLERVAHVLNDPSSRAREAAAHPLAPAELQRSSSPERP